MYLNVALYDCKNIFEKILAHSWRGLDKVLAVCKNIGVSSKIISKLKEVQRKKGLSDKEMAEQLGCSRQLYQMVRTEKVPVGNKILKGISTAFPELHEDIIYFLSNGANKLAKKDNGHDTD